MDEHSWVITSTCSEVFKPKVKSEAILVRARLKNMNGGETREVSFTIGYDEQNDQDVYMQRALEAMRLT